MSTFLKFALAYARHGWPVFPLRPGTKLPLTKHGVKDAAADPDQIREWWGKWPTANVGLATGAASGVLVLDLDVGHGEGLDGEAVLRQHGYGLPVTPMARTARGGLHVYLRHVPEGRSYTGLLCGVDTRGTGGYAVAPPSRTKDGRWRWVEGLGPDVPLANPPGWLVDLLRQRARESPPSLAPASAWAVLWAEVVPEGRRHDTATRLAGHLLAVGHDGAEALALMRVWNDARCRPPLPDKELTRIVTDLAAKEAAAPHHGIEPLPPEEAVADLRRLPSELRLRLLDPTRTLGAMVEALRHGARPGALVALLIDAGSVPREAARQVRWAMRRSADSGQHRSPA